MTKFVESEVENAALNWLESLGWTVISGSDPDMIPGSLFSGRKDYSQVFLENRLIDALRLLNPELPEDAIKDAYRRLTHPRGSHTRSQEQNLP